jgi:hypothetical protein
MATRPEKIAPSEKKALAKSFPYGSVAWTSNSRA